MKNKTTILLKCSLCDVESTLGLKYYKSKCKKYGLEYGTHTCRSCFFKNKWRDESYKTAQLSGRGDKWKQKLSKSVRKSSLSLDKKIKHSESIAKLHRDGRYKKHLHKLNTDKSIAAKRIKTYSQNYLLHHYKRKSEISQKLWQDVDFRIKHANGMASLQSKSKMLIARKRQQLTQRGILNFITEDILKTLKLQFETEKQVAFYLFDYFLSDYNLLLEINGDYWHSLKHGIKNDKAKATYINKHTSFNLLTINEYQFLSSSGIIDILMKATGSKPDIKRFKLSNLKLETTKSYKEFFLAYHYLGNGNSGYCVGAYLKNELIAGVSFGHPHRNQIADGHTLELSRFCIKPGYNMKNLASWLLSRALKYIKRDNPDLKKIVTFADPAVGHTGSIYRASNWEYVGKTESTYWYIDKYAQIYHKLSIWKHARRMSTNEHDFAINHGLVTIDTPAKYKFQYVYHN